MERKSRAGTRLRRRVILTLLFGAVLSLAGPLAAAGAAGPSGLRIGLLMDFSGSTEVARDRRRAFELAIRHVNDGGGVLGRPVTAAFGDTAADPATAVAGARRLVEVEGVHAIVGPNRSADALPVAEHVSGPAGVPTVSFSATSPALSGVADRDFLFRTALSDVSQGPVLARVTRERGFDNVGLPPTGRPSSSASPMTRAGEPRGPQRAGRRSVSPRGDRDRRGPPEARLPAKT